MQAQQVVQGYAVGRWRLISMVLLAAGLLVALVLAADFGFWLKGVSLQSAPSSPALAIPHQQAPDAVTRNAEEANATGVSDGLALPASVPHQQSPDAQERNRGAAIDRGLIP